MELPPAPGPAPTPEPLDLPAGVHHLCSCGRSRHGWFCDGAHLGTGRIAYELTLEEPSTVVLCRCGRSPPLPPLRWQPRPKPVAAVGVLKPFGISRPPGSPQP